MGLFKRKKKNPEPETPRESIMQEPVPAPAEPESPAPEIPQEKPDDGFVEWYRTPTRGGIERRERNDIFEEYSEYGVDKNGALTCRRWHRYPEHEREFDLSYSRALRFDEFNRRLLAELDRGGIKLGDYSRCIDMAEQLGGADDTGSEPEALSDKDKQILEAFCEAMDTFQNKRYLHGEGTLSCECESVVGGEVFRIRFRKPLKYDALNEEISGVSRRAIEGYDIENLWLMSIYNRLRERCASYKVELLTSEWSVKKETIHLFRAEGFEGIGGALIIAAGDPSDMSRFGFWSMDFSAK